MTIVTIENTPLSGEVFSMVVLAEVKLNTLPPLGTPSVRSSEKSDPKRTRRRITKRDRQRVVELYGTGMSTRRIAAKLGLSKTAVLRILHEADVAVRPRGHEPSDGGLPSDGV